MRCLILKKLTMILLKIYDSTLINETTSLKPLNTDKLSSEFKITLEHEDYNLISGFQSYENLQLKNSDRYQYILPYYEFNKTLFVIIDMVLSILILMGIII